MTANAERALWPDSVDPQSALRSAFRAADGASEILLRHYGRLRSVSEKFHAGLVSEADRESEAFIFGHLRGEFPSHAFLGEETGFSSRLGQKPGEPALDQGAAFDDRAEATWVVDPLDGTTNYVHQFPVFCVSIGLESRGELLLGVIDAPKLGVRYHAVRGGGAFANGVPIRASERVELREALFATGFSSEENGLEDHYKMLTVAIKEARGIRRAGAAALDLCFVAQGTFDCFWEKNLKPWDTAAGALIAREAGALVTDLDGNSYHPRLNSLLAGTPAIHAEFRRRLIEVRAGRGPSYSGDSGEK
jgi:myo-inositol-1(or 4)-monophosphatase